MSTWNLYYGGWWCACILAVAMLYGPWKSTDSPVFLVYQRDQVGYINQGEGDGG